MYVVEWQHSTIESSENSTPMDVYTGKLNLVIHYLDFQLITLN